MRFKSRYILCELKFADGTINESFNAGYIFRILQTLVEVQAGDWGMGCTQQSFSVKYYNALTGLLLIRASRDHYRLVCECLPFLTNVKNRPCSLTRLHVGGTIRSCQKAALVHNRHRILETETTKVLTPAQVAAQQLPPPPPTATTAAAVLRADAPSAPLEQSLMVHSATGQCTVVGSEQTAATIAAAEMEICKLE